MPEELASGKKSGLKYKNNITPPRDYDKWAAYITAFNFQKITEERT